MKAVSDLEQLVLLGPVRRVEREASSEGLDKHTPGARSVRVISVRIGGNLDRPAAHVPDDHLTEPQNLRVSQTGIVGQRLFRHARSVERGGSRSCLDAIARAFELDNLEAGPHEARDLADKRTGEGRTAAARAELRRLQTRLCELCAEVGVVLP